MLFLKHLIFPRKSMKNLLTTWKLEKKDCCQFASSADMIYNSFPQAACAKSTRGCSQKGALQVLPGGLRELHTSEETLHNRPPHSGETKGVGKPQVGDLWLLRKVYQEDVHHRPHPVHPWGEEVWVWSVRRKVHHKSNSAEVKPIYQMNNNLF